MISQISGLRALVACCGAAVMLVCLDEVPLGAHAGTMKRRAIQIADLSVRSASVVDT